MMETTLSKERPNTGLNNVLERFFNVCQWWARRLQKNMLYTIASILVTTLGFYLSAGVMSAAIFCLISMVILLPVWMSWSAFCDVAGLFEKRVMLADLLADTKAEYQNNTGKETSFMAKFKALKMAKAAFTALLNRPEVISSAEDIVEGVKSAIAISNPSTLMIMAISSGYMVLQMLIALVALTAMII